MFHPLRYVATPVRPQTTLFGRDRQRALGQSLPSPTACGCYGSIFVTTTCHVMLCQMKGWTWSVLCWWWSISHPITGRSTGRQFINSRE